MSLRTRFLIVDDDEDDVDLFCEALSELDLAATCYKAVNGKQMFEELSSRREHQPDVIFLDINLPLINGWDCLRQLKEDPEFQNIPVIMYSTSSAKKDVELAYTLGALTYLTKTEDYKELMKILQVVANTPDNLLVRQLRGFQSLKTPA